MISWSKSTSARGHLEDLRQILERTWKFGLKMNPKKCAFGVSAGQFLGFLVHEVGIEISLKSQEAVKTMKPPTTKKELQKLIGKINFVRRFISDFWLVGFVLSKTPLNVDPYFQILFSHLPDGLTILSLHLTLHKHGRAFI